MNPIILALIGLGAYLLAGDASRFSFKNKNGSWRAYFDGEPPSKSHVLHDNDGHYVCWDRPVRTEQEARQVAKHWMDTYGR